MRKVRMNVQGRVQGVGFRYMTKLAADELGIAGTVRNEDDGSVSIEAFGTDEKMAEFIQRVKDSPSPAGRVTYVDLQDDPLLEEYSSFKVTN
ncbi:acylphosphatase [Enterococcus sp. DIV0242_7C1]|uniref:acylphosphatase n=1 Tax=Candidatus Enterococcus dunnyi TaxID=1834192 RepID=A0A200JFM9_9ENTE|nr:MULTISPECIES: acylphosphatase [unclassified Enterococcus]MBO0469097.1 acylphosphatase [Enterococcus sp. DIV0242_7C1]MCA5012683.1 acylphosphatase [Enterococcus sp. S23]MCA5015934.1 acylphosphatase [Enterococcus sp. S22(2020)]OUZ35610.1 acylphosphatase [Enterococcus sp. 9D6_DIV0238]